MNYKVLTKAEWRSEANLMDSGVHASLNDVINAKVETYYVTDDVVHVLQQDLPTAVDATTKNRPIVKKQKPKVKPTRQDQAKRQSSIKKEPRLVVFSYANPAPLVHLYFILDNGQLRLFDARTWQDQPVTADVLHDCNNLVKSDMRINFGDLAAAFNLLMPQLYFPLLRIPPNLKQAFTCPYGSLLFGELGVRKLLFNLREVVETENLVLTVPNNTNWAPSTQAVNSILSSSVFRFRLKIEDDVTYTDQLILDSWQLESVGRNFQVKILVIDSLQPFTLPFTCEKLTLLNPSVTVDLANASTTITLVKLSNNEPISIRNASSKLSLHGPGKVSVAESSLDELIVETCDLILSPSIQIKNLIIEFSGRKFLDLNGAVVQQLAIDGEWGVSGEKEEGGILTVVNLVVHGNLILRTICVELSEHSLVYGDCLFPSKYVIPDNFNCLGNIDFDEDEFRF